MLPNQRTFALTCHSCGHVSHLTLVSVSISDAAEVHCPDCGEALGTLGQEKPPARTADPTVQARRRAMSQDTVERQRSSALVRPFLGRISAWQSRSAFLRVELAAERNSEERRRAIRVELGHIRQELLTMLEVVRAAADGALPDGRIRDVLVALERLDEQIRQMLRAEAREAAVD